MAPGLASSVYSCAVGAKCFGGGAPTPECGNGQCESGENEETCIKDCKGAEPFCGNGKCDDGENAETCAKDCIKCGDGKCQGSETTSSCPQDCKTTGPQCGNGKCEEGENSNNCKADCPSTGTQCGDLKCTSPENASTCALDCDPKVASELQCVVSKCASEWATCISNAGCLLAFNCAAGCGDNQSCATACVQKAGSGATALQSVRTCAQSNCSGATTGCKSDSECTGGKKCVDGTCTGGTVSGSCKDKCGKFDAAATCQCDSSCSDPQYNDCCPDLATVCPATP